LWILLKIKFQLQAVKHRKKHINNTLCMFMCVSGLLKVYPKSAIQWYIVLLGI
jgi:hypothetical protein